MCQGNGLVACRLRVDRGHSEADCSTHIESMLLEFQPLMRPHASLQTPDPMLAGLPTCWGRPASACGIVPRRPGGMTSILSSLIESCPHSWHWFCQGERCPRLTEAHMPYMLLGTKGACLTAWFGATPQVQLPVLAYHVQNCTLGMKPGWI